MRALHRPAPAALALLALISMGGRARADGDSKDPRVVEADRLFVEGRALLNSNLLQACAKFDESLRFNNAAIGTLLNVALCDEKLGKVASAVAKFSEARERAREQGLNRHVLTAEEHITALEPDVPYLAITLAEMLPGTKILVDDQVIALEQISKLPLDPGEREIVVSAPARLPYRKKFVIGKAERKDIVIPALAQSVTVKSSQRLVGQILTASGSGVMTVGLVLGFKARSDYRNQFGHTQPGDGKCDDHGFCEAEGLSKTRDARALGTFATYVGIIGVGVAAVGVIVWATAPRSTQPDRNDKRFSVAPQISDDSVGVVATGRF